MKPTFLPKCLKFIFLSCFIVQLNQSFALQFSKEQTFTTDPLSITFEDFQDKLFYYLDMMKGDESFTEEEYIEMVLVDNTLFVMMSQSNPKYKVNVHKDYLDFLKEYMEDILKVLKADKQGCNGGFYSKKYDLCIGGTAPNKNSTYTFSD